MRGISKFKGILQGQSKFKGNKSKLANSRGFLQGRSKFKGIKREQNHGKMGIF